MKNIVLSMFLGLSSYAGYAGGFGGGSTPPAIELNALQLQSLQNQSDFIRLAIPGEEIYFKADKLRSVPGKALLAQNLGNGEMVVFYVKDPAKYSTEIEVMAEPGDSTPIEVSAVDPENLPEHLQNSQD
jgi:hypothetical protein